MKKNTVKETILDAALEVVSENTISGTRMHLIAEKAGVAQSNLHYHFNTKKDLMLEMYSKMQQKFCKDREEFVKIFCFACPFICKVGRRFFCFFFFHRLSNLIDRANTGVCS